MNFFNWFFTRNEIWDNSRILALRPYSTQSNGSTATIQVMERVETRYVALQMKSKKWGIFKVITRKYFQDFGVTCTQLKLKFMDKYLHSEAKP